MKRTFPANIDGQIFYIDEDAYLMLQDYLQALKNTFHGSEGDEIISDIESRIRELFAERIACGASVIVRADVASVIETMGRPELLTADDEQPAEGPSQATEMPREESKPFIEFNLPKRKRLYRNMRNKVFGGVLGGLASYLGWNANILRLFYVILTIAGFSWGIGLFLIILYLVGWMIIPPANTPAKVLQMRGEPVNVDTIGQEFMASSPSAAKAGTPEESNNFFSMMFSVIGKIILGILGILGTIIFIGGIIGFITVTIIQIVCEVNPEVFEFFPWDGSLLIASMILVWILAGIIAGGALAWTASCALLNTTPASRTFKIIALIMEILLISAGITLSIIVAGM